MIPDGSLPRPGGQVMHQRAVDYFRTLQDRITNTLEQVDAAGRFKEDVWQREGGGGGRSRVIVEGGVFEKGGVNFSEVQGELSEDLAKQLPGEGRSFTATGISVVMHPRSPFVPTAHMNLR